MPLSVHHTICSYKFYNNSNMQCCCSVPLYVRVVLLAVLLLLLLLMCYCIGQPPTSRGQSQENMEIPLGLREGLINAQVPQIPVKIACHCCYKSVRCGRGGEDGSLEANKTQQLSQQARVHAVTRPSPPSNSDALVCISPPSKRRSAFTNTPRSATLVSVAPF